MDFAILIDVKAVRSSESLTVFKKLDRSQNKIVKAPIILSIKNDRRIKGRIVAFISSNLVLSLKVYKNTCISIE